ncbi:hypothetical protein M9458_022174, partial [Cirrhinus mrigala]
MTKRSSVRFAQGFSPLTVICPSTKRNMERSSMRVKSAIRCSTAKMSCRTTRGGMLL